MSDVRTETDQRWLDPQHVWEILRTQYVTFGGFLLAVLVAAFVGTSLMEKQYRAVALLHLMPRAGQEVSSDEVVEHDAAGYMEGRERARTQIQIMLSRSVREEVLFRYNDLGFDDLKPMPADLARFGGMLSAGPREDTQLVEIRVVHSQPDRAAALANLVAEVYREGNLDARRDAARSTKEWIDTKSDEYAVEVEYTSQALLDFKSDNDVVDIDEKIDGISARRTALQEAYGQTTTQRVLVESNLTEHERLLAAGKTAVLAGMFDDPTLDALSREHANVVTRTAELVSLHGPQHPDSKAAFAHRVQLETLISEEVQRAVDGERAEARTLRRQESRLDAELAEVKLLLLEKQRLQDLYDELKTSHDRTRKTWDRLGERGTEVDLQAQTRLNDVRVVDWALAPSSPIKPSVPLNMAVALAVGLCGGFGLALVRSRMDAVISTPEQVERLLGESLLGVVPRLGATGVDSRRALAHFLEQRSLAAEAMHAVRAVLIAHLGRGRTRRLVVTSCLEGEGKSVVAAGLAVAYAELGASVLLIEGDLARPRLHQMFGVEPGGGLTAALDDQHNPERFVQSSRIENLYLLPAGVGTPNPGRVLSSPQFEDLLEHLGETWRVVIIDAPTATLVPDAASLASHADGVIVVARSGAVTRSISRRTVASLRKAGARVLGVVLNDVNVKRPVLRVESGFDRRRDDRSAAR